ncbi:MAG: hypothetical protein JKX69_00740 [Rhodobacteraceae bacterium]|nr:hypothetical protein [Paracoccaceae bacterium]MBL4810898.1 hypothetical protein [Paracoccaceae bacterium]
MSQASLETRFANMPPLAAAKAYLADAVLQAGAVPAEAPSTADIQHIGVVGAGTMGRGIVLAFVNSGRKVTLIDPSQAALDNARAHIQKLTQRQVSKGRIDDASALALLDRVAYGRDVSVLAPVDLVVEVVPEIIALKQKVLSELCEICGPNTILASNTSTLDIEAIATATGAPERVIGTHFFVPAQANKLLEIIPSKLTAPSVLATILALAKDLKKHAVVAGNRDGFIGNRLFDRFHQEAMYLLEEGALPGDIDTALEEWGMLIGPFKALDLIGNDIPWGVRQQRAKNDPTLVQPRVGDALCEAGLFGQKTGKGWYLYDAQNPQGRAYDEGGDLIAGVCDQLGKTRRAISANEIVNRCVLALIREAWALVEEGVAQRETDVDMVYVTGYGFPAARGGPFALGHQFGLRNVVDMVQYYGAFTGQSETIWSLPETLKIAAGAAHEDV